MNKLVVVIMGQDCERFIDMSLESVKDADDIVYCDGGSEHDFWSKKYIETYFGEEAINDLYNPIWGKVKVISNEYDQDDKEMNGKQRNFYLDYVKKNYPDWWCLCIDADEVVGDINAVKEAINQMPPGVYSPKIRHFVGDLGHEDATQPEHWVPNRLFKISEVEDYPEVEHPVLIPKEGVPTAGTRCTTIWHFRECLGVFETNKKHKANQAKSNMHTPGQLDWWYYSMLFGHYPKRDVAWYELPEIIRKRFEI